jgi:hypothetical protein
VRRDVPTNATKPKPSQLHESNGQATHAKPAASPAELVLARDPNLLARIQEDIAAVGLVGEMDNGLLTYLIYTSRLLANPGAIVTRGKTSGGKSTVLDKVALLFPDDCKIDGMKLTEASLFRAGPDYLKHKILKTGERKHATDDKTRDDNAMVRQLLSEKKVTRQICIRDGAEWITENQVREGPVAYAESTTAGSIFAEDLNRMLQVYIDESEKQTRAIMHAIASKYDNSDKPNVAKIIDIHHRFQSLLRPHKVYIPFWNELEDRIPSKKLEVRRVIQQILTIIEATVVLHQFQRDKKDGFLVATLDDYAVARRLLLRPVHEAVGIRKDDKEAQLLRAKIKTDTFTTPEVKKALAFKNDMGPSRLMKRLVETGMLVRLSARKGAVAARYQWARKPESLVLPTVEEVRADLPNDLTRSNETGVR